MNKVKILFWGDAVVETGFARVLHSIAKFLPAKYDISWIGVNYYGDPHKYPYRIYPASTRGDVYGLGRFNDIALLEEPDIIFILNDAWIQHAILETIKKTYQANPKLRKPKIVTYTPVDAKDHDPDWYKNFDIVDKAVAYTEFGNFEIRKAMPSLESKMSIIPHGVDTSIFYKMDKPKSEIKKLVYPNNDTFLDSFIVLNANRNQPRKRVDITLKAFELFSKNKPENVKLYMHMGIVDSHVNIKKLAERYGIDNRLIMTSMRQGVQNIPIERLNLIYNATDVGINTGVGEGWGLTSIEHAITGAPQVLADHSALRELYYDCGILVPATTEFVLEGIMTTGYLVRPEDVAEKLEFIYQNKDIYNELSKKAMEKFHDPRYSWINISKQWANLFEEIL